MDISFPRTTPGSEPVSYPSVPLKLANGSRKWAPLAVVSRMVLLRPILTEIADCDWNAALALDSSQSECLEEWLACVALVSEQKKLQHILQLRPTVQLKWCYVQVHSYACARFVLQEWSTASSSVLASSVAECLKAYFRMVHYKQYSWTVSR